MVGQRTSPPRILNLEWVSTRARLVQILELLETVVLHSGYRQSGKRCSAMDWLVYWNGKSFAAARSSEAAGENGLATFAYRIILLPHRPGKAAPVERDQANTVTDDRS
jgi:hypothetical protein